MAKYDITQPKLKKIAICGTACQGKSTLIRDMIARWPALSTPEKTYRDVIKEKNLTINQEGNATNQEIILNALVDQLMYNYGKKKVIFDRCPLDNLIYTLWLNEKHPDRVPDEFVQKTITIVRESLKMLDCIFFIPLTRVHKIPLVADQLRDIDPQYVEEIDNLFKAVIQTVGVGKFFPMEDCPPVIEVFGDRETRIKMLELYLDEDGEFRNSEQSILTDLAIDANLPPEFQNLQSARR